jgi:hypothetical protein
MCEETYKCPHCKDGYVFCGEGVGHEKCDECEGTGRLPGKPCEHDAKATECVSCLTTLLNTAVAYLRVVDLKFIDPMKSPTSKERKKVSDQVCAFLKKVDETFAQNR